jgi:hypothetical protein
MGCPDAVRAELLQVKGVLAVAYHLDQDFFSVQFESVLVSLETIFAALTQISLGKFRVGITGLKAAIEELKSWRGRSEDEIAQALLARVKTRNYIPASAQEEYKLLQKIIGAAAAEI